MGRISETGSGRSLLPAQTWLDIGLQRASLRQQLVVLRSGTCPARRTNCPGHCQRTATAQPLLAPELPCHTGSRLWLAQGGHRADISAGDLCCLQELQRRVRGAQGSVGTALTAAGLTVPCVYSGNAQQRRCGQTEAVFAQRPSSPRDPPRRPRRACSPLIRSRPGPAWLWGWAVSTDHRPWPTW